ncbi:MAG: type II toxin-antitoxin system VapC family toxin [Solirubrobacterales bacterium]
MTTFVDTSVLYAAVDEDDPGTARAREILAAEAALATSDHVLAETWRLARDLGGWQAAEELWGELRAQVEIAPILDHDLAVAWEIGRSFADQEFSLVDRTSFAVMERLGITRVASFDDDFVVYRYGARRERAFEVLR